MSEPEQVPDANTPCPYVTGKTTRYCTLTPFTLTAAEREAIERAIETLDGWQKTGGYHSAIEDDAATLRGLLDRTQTVRT